MAIATPETTSLAGIEMFLAGLQTDSAGQQKLWTPDELDEIASAYNEVSSAGIHDAPILVGHDGNTAYGWIAKADRAGSILKGDYKEVDPAFAESVNKGTYKKVSISIYPRSHPANPTPGRYNIRHLAYVGVPAVKGLKSHKFADSDNGEGILTYAETPLMFWSAGEALAFLVQGLRDRLIAADGIEAADAQFPQSAIDRIKTLSEEFSQNSRYLDERLAMLQSQLDQLFKLTARSESPMYTEFAEIAALAKSKDMDAAALAKASKLSVEVVQAIWSGEASPTLPQTSAIAKALGVEASELGGSSASSKSKSKSKTTDMSETNQTQDETQASGLTAQFAEMQKQMSALQLQLNASQAQVATLSAANTQLANERERDRVTSFVDGLIHHADGAKVLPCDRASVIELAMSMPNDAPVSFAEGDGTIERTVRWQYLESLSKAKPLVGNRDMPTRPGDAPTNFAEAGIDTESIKADARIRAKVAEMGGDPNSAADYAEAMTALGFTY